MVQQIDVYGNIRLELNLGLPYRISWNFTVTDVLHVIIGADLLAYLLPDLQLRKLVDVNQNVVVAAFLRPACSLQVSLLAPNHKYSDILGRFPRVIGPDQIVSVKSRNVFHHTLTTGPPISQRAHCLRPEKLKAAKQVFRKMCESGICRPSSSSWASLLYMVPKKNGEWRPCGNYIKLNSVTVPDKYLVTHMFDCKTFCSGKKIFSALDLRQTYHQIPVAPADIEKTFQRYINLALGDLDYVFVYIDDVFVASSSEEEHRKHLKAVIGKLNDFELQINLEK